MVEDLQHKRHSVAHILAKAVLEKFPDAKLAIGPAIDSGCYYDFEFPTNKPTEKDLKEIEKRVKKIIAGNYEFHGKEISYDEARKLFSNQPYKLELIDEIENKKEKLTIYTFDDFTDLCRGGHILNTKEINPKAIKFDRVAGAYWRGDEKNKMLTRIYFLVFDTEDELKNYIKEREEAKKIDHRVLGQKLELFTIIDDIGLGLPLFYPKGAILRKNVEEFIEETQRRAGYKPIWIPHITKEKLYQISGHLSKYDAMFPPMEVDKEKYYLKPMNCPHFMMLFKSLNFSYRDLPQRWTSTTTNYRYEKSGELSGLTRVRALTQDDCHIFCRQDQIKDEIKIILEMIKYVYQVFKFDDFWVRISKMDKNNKEGYIGSDEIWDSAEQALKEVVSELNFPHKEEDGEAAFYGPKLDFMLKDALKREWQLSTVQLDFNLPQRFELYYIDEDGKKKTPVVIHRAILGSTERFLGILIEHLKGKFPLWLAPEQVRILTVSEKFKEYAKKINNFFVENNIRSSLDDSDHSLGKKVREARIQKTPYIIVLGEKEEKEEKITAQKEDSKFELITKEEFLDILKKEIENKI